MTGRTTAAQQSTVSPSKVLDLIGSKLDLVEEELRRNFRSRIRTIDEVGTHILDGGGKRIRPILLLLVSSMLDYEGTTDVVYAAVVEFIHTATLVHDDIIDEAEIRRGRSSINHRWGNHLTVLVGDYLYTHAMKMALREKSLEVVELLCDTTIQMTEGEILGLENKGRVDLTSDEYFDVVGRKTAALFGASCLVPSHLISSSQAEADRLYKYGYDLGICFQLIDDLLDFTSSTEVLGKPTVSDLKEGKMTLPVILALPMMDDAERSVVERIVSGRFDLTEDPSTIVDIVQRYGGVERTRNIAREYADRALGHLEYFPPSAAREGLEYAVHFVLDRDR